MLVKQTLSVKEALGIGFNSLGADIIINPVPNWTDITGIGSGESNEVTILGINAIVELEIITTIISGNILPLFFKNGTVQPNIISVSSGDLIKISASTFGGGSASLQIVNKTNSNNVLDTISAVLADGGGI